MEGFLRPSFADRTAFPREAAALARLACGTAPGNDGAGLAESGPRDLRPAHTRPRACARPLARDGRSDLDPRSEEHTSELQSLMRISYAVVCLKKKKKRQT